MLDRLFGYKVHYFLHVLGMSVLAFGLPLNKVLMSIGAIWGVSNLVLEGEIKTYWLNIQKNTPFKWLLAFCFIHIIGIFWSTDIPYALHDIQIKLPLLAVPLALVARPITKRNHIHFIFYALLVSLLITSFLNFGYYQQWFGVKNYTDIRQLSLFGSHIRYGILIALGASICVYFIVNKINTKLNWIWIIVLIWFCFYTFYSQVLSGVLSLLIIFFVLLLFYSSKYSKLLPWIFGFVLISGAYGLFLFLQPKKSEEVNISNLPLKTKEGNLYTNDFSNPNRENNKPIFISVCDVELEREWNKISPILYDKRDYKGQFIKHTLIRYLASKGLTKDAEGIKSLNKSDIKNIENGIASIEQLKSGLTSRLNDIKFQFNNSFDPNGHSILQRLEYWKTGLHILQKNYILGVGTGDVQLAFDKQYEKENSILLPQNRLRAHNTYITVLVTFGMVGFTLFIGFLFSFFKLNFQNKEFVALMFFSVAIATFFIEDTLETHMGVSIIALFIGLFITKKEDSIAID